MDKLSAIRVFVAIATHGSLTEAANRLGKSLPTVVRVLKSLEEQLEFQLFIRNTRKIEITKEGKKYLDMCLSIIAQMADTENELRGNPSDISGTATISAPEMFGRIYVAPLLIESCKNYPNLNIVLLLSDAVLDVVKNNIDIAVRLGDLPDSNLLARRVGSVRRVICGSSKLIDRVGKPFLPEDLKNKPCLAIDVAGRRSGMQWRFMRSDGSEYRLSVDPVFTTNRNDVARRACITGLGFSMFWDYQVWDALQDGQLTQVLSEHDPAPRPVYILRSGQRHSAPHYLNLTRYLEKEIRAKLTIKDSWDAQRRLYNI